MRVPRKSSRIIPIAFSFWISAEGHSASRLCAAVLLLDSDGQAVRKGDQCPHGRDGHAPFFLRSKVQIQRNNDPPADVYLKMVGIRLRELRREDWRAVAGVRSRLAGIGGQK